MLHESSTPGGPSTVWAHLGGLFSDGARGRTSLISLRAE